MECDVDNVISIKQHLDNSISDIKFDYIKQIINKNVDDCNLLYTQVCYLIKLFLLNDYENNNNKYNDYKFDELFIRKCFKLIKTNTLDINNSTDNNLLINRLCNFYKQYNLNESNEFKFIKPIDVCSITHITNALSRDIQTNITNNIKINFLKYVKEYIKVNLKHEFDKIDNKQIMKVYNDVISNTLYSESKYHSWINKHIKLILPKFDNNINIKNFKDGIDNYNGMFVKFINKYVKENQNLLNIVKINNENENENKNKIIKLIIELLINKDANLNKNDDLNKNNDINICNYNNWIDENKNIIVNDFNLSNKNDIDKELDKNPYLFIPYMLFMNKNIELMGSKKKYQIIPLRTNLTPKFIPISIDSFVDILDSKYLLGKVKNYYHNDNKKGLILFETYFKFDSKYIKNIIKKGYVFSGLIYTNGFEINYIFNSKSYETNKINFHLSGKKEREFIKLNTQNMKPEEKEKFILKHEQDKELEKNEKKKLNNEKIKIDKQNAKENHDKILKSLEPELTKLNNDYNDELLKIKNEHYENLELEFKDIDKTNIENKKIMNEITEKLNEILASKTIYLKHEYDRNYSSLVNDYNNLIDIKHENIKQRQIQNDNSIKEIKNKILTLKNDLKNMKKEKLNTINKEYKNKTKKINSNLNNNKKMKKMLNRLINKIKRKVELLKYETLNNKALTILHVFEIKENLSNMLLKISKIFEFDMFNNYINIINEGVEDYLISNEYETNKQFINTCLKYISIEKINKLNETEEQIKLATYRMMKIEQISKIKTKEYEEKYNKTIKEISDNSKELNKLINKKNKLDNEIMDLFKDKNKEYVKVDNMSKKTLSILDKMNWVVIDPGTNSLLTMLSKNGKTKMSYSKCHYVNKIKRKKILSQIEKIKKEKITKLENKLTKEKTRLKTSNIYKNFNEYFTLKMKIHNEINDLYKDPRLIKLQWYSFINEKRSLNYVVNKIKSKFGSDAVLLMGDWSMNKSAIKSISTPNKKYNTLLKKHFMTLGLNEFRTSIIESQSHLRCENLIKSNVDYKKIGIKEIYSLEKLKISNLEKYKKKTTNKKIHKILTCKTSEKLIKYKNRDINAVKNMLNIVSSYILNNKKPIAFVMGTKICNGVQHPI